MAFCPEQEIAKIHADILDSTISGDLNIFHDNNPDAIIEYIPTATPDFNDQASLMYYRTRRRNS